MSRGLGKIQRQCLSVLTSQDKLLDSIAVAAIAVGRNEITDIEHVSFRRHCESLKRWVRSWTCDGAFDMDAGAGQLRRSQSGILIELKKQSDDTWLMTCGGKVGSTLQTIRRSLTIQCKCSVLRLFLTMEHLSAFYFVKHLMVMWIGVIYCEKSKSTVPSGAINQEIATGTISCIDSVLFIGETKLKDLKSRVFGVKTQVPAQTAHVRRCVAIRRRPERLTG